jgi:DNA polymerase (family 10)
MPEVIQILEKGNTKSAVKLNTGMNADIRFYLNTASARHCSIHGQQTPQHRAQENRAGQGLEAKRVWHFPKTSNRGRTERGLRETRIKWIPPELRENTGEIEAAKKGELPNLIEYKDLKGDFRAFEPTDGQNSIRRWLSRLKERVEYIVISDHQNTSDD